MVAKEQLKLKKNERSTNPYGLETYYDKFMILKLLTKLIRNLRGIINVELNVDSPSP